MGGESSGVGDRAHGSWSSVRFYNETLQINAENSQNHQIKMNTPPKNIKNHAENAEKRMEMVIKWLQKHKILLLQTDSVKVELNISGQSVKGTVTQFPTE